MGKCFMDVGDLNKGKRKKRKRRRKSCIHAAVDFLSPESVAECQRLSEKLRSLPQYHSLKEDELQVKRMTLQAIRQAIADLEYNTLLCIPEEENHCLPFIREMMKLIAENAGHILSPEVKENTHDAVSKTVEELKNNWSRLGGVNKSNNNLELRKQMAATWESVLERYGYVIPESTSMLADIQNVVEKIDAKKGGCSSSSRQH